MATVSKRHLPKLLPVISAIAFSTFLGQRPSPADESGVSFWQPGTFANLAAVPGRRDGCSLQHIFTRHWRVGVALRLRMCSPFSRARH